MYTMQQVSLVSSYRNFLKPVFPHDNDSCGELPTPECSAQDLRVEPLLVFADLRCVALRPGVNRVDIDHGSLTGRVLPQGLLQPRVVPIT